MVIVYPLNSYVYNVMTCVIWTYWEDEQQLQHCITMYYNEFYWKEHWTLCILCITMYTMLYSVLQWSTMEYNGLRPWGHSPLFFKRKEKENGGRKKNFHVKNVFGVNACREEYALHPYHISPIFI